MFNLFSTCFLGLILIYFPQASYTQQQNPNCVPSACGNIQNISYPFRLTGDPEHCGDSSYEIVCENNTTAILYLYSQRYIVQAINYQNYTIRLADASVNNDTCSFPQYSLNYYVKYLMEDYPYSIFYFDHTLIIYDMSQPATFLSCPHPLNHSFYINTTSCVGGDEALNSSRGRYAYIKAGYVKASDLGDMCSIHAVVMISIPYTDCDNITLPEFHSYLLYGFQLSWFSALCDDHCRRMGSCVWNGTQAVCVINPWRVNTIDIVIQIANRVILFFIVIYLGLKFVFGIPIILGLLIYMFRRRHLSVFEVIEDFLQNPNHLTPIRYSYSEIKEMTKGFREKLGQGGYGSVYKGKLRSGRDVAVKVLSSKAKANGQDFMNEVATIGRIHHVNVVKLVGYSAELSKRALVYDLMPNGSLEKYVLGKDRTDALDWKKKFDITVGVARGIEYLHRGCDIHILHFDIKPHNILLDENFTPKISDFGLAKFYPTDHNTVNLTAVRGTIGYVAPELINRSIGSVSYKADVYSFGMLLMEMVGLNRNMVGNTEDSSMYFPYWIYNHLDKWKDVEIGNVHEIADAEADDDDKKTTRKMTIVALWCIQMSPVDRPSMNKVVEMLQGDVGSLQVPPRPSYSPQIPECVDQTWETSTTGY